MSFRTLVAANSRAILIRPVFSLFPRSIPLAAVRWNSSTASEWADREPNFLLLKPRIQFMLESLTNPTAKNLSYTEKLAKLSEGFRDNSDLQSTVVTLSNVPNIITVESVREYVSKFGTVVECHPTREGLFRVKFSAHEEAKKAVESINSATEYPINIEFDYNIKLPLIADYAPPTNVGKARKPTRTIMVHLYAGEIQAVVDAFAKHATVGYSRLGVSHRHGVETSNLFVSFGDVQDAKKVFDALDGKVTIDGHQYNLAYGRERSDQFGAAPRATRNEYRREKRNEYPRAKRSEQPWAKRNEHPRAKRNE